MARRHCRLLACLLLLLAIGIAVGSYWYWTRPTHEVVAYLGFRSTLKLNTEDGERFRYESGDPDDERREMERVAALIVSPLVLGPVVADAETAAILKAEADPIAWLQDKLEFTIAGPGLLMVRMPGRSSEMEGYAAVLDSIVHSYFTLESGYEDTRFAEVIHQLNERRQMLQQKIVQLTESIRMTTLEASGTDGTGHSVDLEFKQQELERAKKVLNAIGDKISELETNKSAPMRVHPLQGATVRERASTCVARFVEP